MCANSTNDVLTAYAISINYMLTAHIKEGKRMFNLSSIMNEAWGSYRRSYNKRPTFQRSTFNWLLMLAWKRAKDAAMRASNPALAKIEALREQIEMLSYKPWRINIECRRRELEAKIASLCAVARQG